MGDPAVYVLAGLGFTDQHVANLTENKKEWKSSDDTDQYPTTIMVSCQGPFTEEDRATVYAMVRGQPTTLIVRRRVFTFGLDMTHGVRVDIFPPRDV